MDESNGPSVTVEPCSRQGARSPERMTLVTSSNMVTLVPAMIFRPRGPFLLNWNQPSRLRLEVTELTKVMLSAQGRVLGRKWMLGSTVLLAIHFLATTEPSVRIPELVIHE